MTVRRKEEEQIKKYMNAQTIIIKITMIITMLIMIRRISMITMKTVIIINSVIQKRLIK